MAQAHRGGTELVHVGFGNFLAVNKVLAIVTPSSGCLPESSVVSGNIVRPTAV